MKIHYKIEQIPHERDKRHSLRRVKQNSVTKELNTVIEPGVDVAADVAAINKGLVKKNGNTNSINERVYGTHDGALYPISGEGFHTLNRGAYQVLGILNKFGNTERAHEIIGNLNRVGKAEVEAALNAWRKGQ